MLFGESIRKLAECFTRRRTRHRRRHRTGGHGQNSDRSRRQTQDTLPDDVS